MHMENIDLLAGTPPDWRYCQINSIIIDYREQSVLIEWIVWVCMFKRGLVRRYKCHISWRVCKSGISWWVCKSTGYPGVCARADILASVQGRDILTGVQEWDTLSCVQEQDILTCVKEQDVLAGVKEQDVLAGVQERDILTGTPPDWRYCQINSIIIDYREQSVLIEWVVWV